MQVYLLKRSIHSKNTTKEKSIHKFIEKCCLKTDRHFQARNKASWMDVFTGWQNNA